MAKSRSRKQTNQKKVEHLSKEELIKQAQADMQAETTDKVEDNLSQESSKEEIKLDKVETKLSQNMSKVEKKLDEVEKKLDEKKAELKNTEDELESKKDKLKEIDNKKNELNKREKELNKRENELNEKEINLKDKEYLNESKMNVLISEKQKEKVAEMYDNISKLQQIEEKKLDDIEKNRMAILKKEEERRNTDLETREEIFNKKLDAFNTEKAEFEKEKELLEYEKEKFKIEKYKYDELQKKLNEEAENKYEEIENKYEEGVRSLRNKLGFYVDQAANIEIFKTKYGEGIEEIEANFERLENANKLLNETLATRPLPEVKDENDYLKERIEELKNKCKNFLDAKEEKFDNEDELRKLRLEKKKFEAERESLMLDLKLSKDRITKLEAEYKRLTTLDEEEASREARIQEIKNRYIDEASIFSGTNDNTNEIKFVNQIWQQCEKYGFNFNKRIIYAFHTALKISDWSIITVLAGVSGTGKSELPRLYSAFGGLNFISVPVQPNWDSQESMLGYFNSIDNRFDAQPLLRFLAQVTDKEEKVSNFMSLILLDEMNLAHVEYYFAEFLSKLELRRGTMAKSLPNIEIKIGAGIKPFNLELSRTLLWTGTMNQDETTKSLSDKVLDRGIVINFPRPTKLSTRKNMKPLRAFIEDSNRPMLDKKVWNGWIVRELEEIPEVMKLEIEKCKKFVDLMNKELKHCGRALGHRVWQSIEYYIVNHPFVNMAKKNEDDEATLRESIRFAFEDQIVQKIMPKLRGVETTGNGKKTLEGLKAILTSNDEFSSLLEDFKFAEEIGYGQFIWSSAEYLETSENLYDKLEKKLLGE